MQKWKHSYKTKHKFYQNSDTLSFKNISFPTMQHRSIREHTANVYPPPYWRTVSTFIKTCVYSIITNFLFTWKITIQTPITNKQKKLQKRVTFMFYFKKRLKFLIWWIRNYTNFYKKFMTVAKACLIECFPKKM